MLDCSYNLMKKEILEQRRLCELYRKKRDKVVKYKGTHLRTSMKHKRTYYYRHEKDKSIYLGNARNTEVQKIQEWHFYDEIVQSLEVNIRLMEKMLRGYRPMNTDALKKRIPKKYIPIGIYTDQDLISDENEIRKKYKAMKEYKNSIPSKYPEDLKITAFDGTQVRSKTEAMIYARLCAAGFYVIYEFLIEIEDGRYICPDFLLIHPVTGQIYLWEHLGRWFGPGDTYSYRRSYLQKMDFYSTIGFAAGINLFTSFEPEDGLDMEKINETIEHLYSSKVTNGMKNLTIKQSAIFCKFVG